MRFTKTTTLLACALALASTSALAGPKDLEKFDANGDGYLDREEYEARSAKWMEKAGVTDEAEKKKRLDKAFAKQDTNGDGKLSADELEAAAMKNRKKNET